MEEEQSYAQAVSPNIIVHSAIVMPYFYNYGTPEQESKSFDLDAPTRRSILALLGVYI